MQLLLATITIMTDDFEWDRTKAAANYKKHGVRFEHAVLAFEDPFALVELDESEEYGEDRFLLTGRAADGIVVVVYTERGERVRIISAREATEYERRNYYRAAQED
ncbi:MAG TPA: BrnT family toxin [Xanthobacteraceae bacterium]|nr:BrnT family toxin [Xanthobacteraceae bacterium]